MVKSEVTHKLNDLRDLLHFGIMNTRKTDRDNYYLFTDLNIQLNKLFDIIEDN